MQEVKLCSDKVIQL